MMEYIPSFGINSEDCDDSSGYIKCTISYSLGPPFDITILRHETRLLTGMLIESDVILIDNLSGKMISRTKRRHNGYKTAEYYLGKNLVKGIIIKGRKIEVSNNIREGRIMIFDYSGKKLSEYQVQERESLYLDHNLHGLLFLVFVSEKSVFNIQINIREF